MKRDGEYESWAGMIQRCTNKNHIHYKYYGGKGITVCKEWLKSYTTFLSDMGRKPFKDYTLDCINNSLDYCKSNCKWSSREEQVMNRSCVKVTKDIILDIRKLFLEGEKQLSLANKFNIKLDTVHKIVRFKSYKNIK